MLHSFLMIGQSNMAGRGFLSEAVPMNTGHIKLFRNGRWQPMFRPINPDKQTAGVSPAESFAEAYAKAYDVNVGLIGCAVGGTSLDEWMPGDTLYDNAISQARLAARSSEIVGILWHQGEWDTNPENASTYRVRLEHMISSLRRDLNLPNAPLILGELGSFLEDLGGRYKNYRKVNEEIHEFVKLNPFSACASADGLTSNGDNLHFNSKSLYELGLRYFSEFQKLCDKNK